MELDGCLEITTVSMCPRLCGYCPQDLLKKEYGDGQKVMSLETFKTCVSKLPQNVMVTFSGYAECFTNKLAPDMICWANEQNRPIALHSTLTGLTVEGLNKIKNIPFKTISLHMPDDQGVMKANVNDEYCKMVREFNSTFPNAKVHVHGVLHRKLEPIVGYKCQRMNFEYQVLHTRANNVVNEQILLQVRPKLRGRIQCDVINRDFKDNPNRSNIINIGVLLPDGTVTLCCMDYGLKHKLGNLLVDSYEDLFNSAEYKRVMKGMTDESENIICRECSEAKQV